MSKDYYKILGVERSATEGEIKKAYRQLAIKYHPDKNPDDKVSEEKFKEVAEAYHILSNPEKKAKFDQFGERFEGAPPGYEEMWSDLRQEFGEAFGDYSRIRRDGNGSQRASREHARRGQDLKVKMPITLEEINSGVTRKIKYKRTGQCGSCMGNGSKNGTSVDYCTVCDGKGQREVVSKTVIGNITTYTPCFTCGGNGKKVIEICGLCDGRGSSFQNAMEEIKIPAGVWSGMEIIGVGLGNAPVGEGTSGNLIIEIEEIPNKKFKRNKQHLHLEKTINYADAVLGGKVDVETIDGKKLSMTIPKGTKDGKALKLKGEGIKYIEEKRDRHGRISVGNVLIGDLVVTIKIDVPDKIGEEESELLEKMKTMEGFTSKK